MMATNQVKHQRTNLELKDILNELANAGFSADWYQLGIQLKLSDGDLRQIEVDFKLSEGAKRCLSECLSLWLKAANDDANPPSWKVLAGALRRIGWKAAAKTVEELSDPACQILQKYSDRFTEVAIPPDLLNLLYTEKIIDGQTLDKMERDGGHLMDGPFSTLRSAVKKNHDILKRFASALSESEETISLANGILRECDQEVVEGVKKSKSAEQEQIFQISLYQNFEAEFELIRGDFGLLLHKFAPLIKAAIPSIIPSLDDLKSYLKRCYKELEPQLSQAKSIDDVIDFIEDKCSIININVLRNIGTKGYNINGADVLIQEYEKKFKEFCKKQVHQLEIKKQSHSLLKYNTIKITLNWEPEDCTLKKIEEVLRVAYGEYCERVEVLSFNKDCSITIICYAPHHLMDILLLEAEGNIDQLKGMGLIHLTIGYYTVYDNTNDKVIEKLTNEIEDRVKEVTELEETVSQLTDKLMLDTTEKETLCKEIEQLKQTLKDKEDYIQSLADNSVSQLRERLNSKERIMKSMILEIDQLKSHLNSKEGMEYALVECRKEIELLQEKITTLNLQLLEKTEQNQEIEDIKPLVAKLSHDINTDTSVKNLYAGITIIDVENDFVTFATTKHLNDLLMYIKKNHPKAETGQCIQFSFQPSSNYIELIFDDSHQNDPCTGWIIRPQLKPCRLLKSHIDNFGNKEPPIPVSCLISVYSIDRPDTVPVLNYGIPLEGIDPPVTIFIHRALRTTNTGTPLEATPSSSSVHQSTLQPSFTLPSSVTRDQLRSVVRQLRQVLDGNQVVLDNLFRQNIQSISRELRQVGILPYDPHQTHSYDAIITCFEIGLSFKRNTRDFEVYCNKFISALANVGGPCTDAAEMITDEWNASLQQL